MTPGVAAGSLVVMPSLGTPPRLHLSVDDVSACLADLGGEAYGSPWGEPTLAALRALHERHGVVVSLYVFERSGSWRLSDVPSRYRAHFAEAASWLRFGFHARDRDSHYGSAGVSVARAAADYRRFAHQVRRFAGAAAIDRMPRVHRFLGRLEVVRAWRDQADGVRGLLCADDERSEVYHLGDALREALLRDGAAFDEREGLELLPSLTRLEGSVGDLERALDAAAVRPAVRAGGPICLFTHEPNLSEPRVRARIEVALRWARRRGSGYAFPLDALEHQVPASRSCS